MSVVVATYNQATYIPQCLDSLVNQRMPTGDFEVIVVDDGSTDQSAEIIADYGEAIAAVVFKHNRGLAAACNAGIDMARGEFVVRVDSDDWLDETALARLVEAAQSAGPSDILIPDYWIVDGDDVRVRTTNVDNLFTWMAGGTLLRRSAVAAAGGYRAFFWEEFDLYLRMLLSGAVVAPLNEPVLYHREHSTSMTAHTQARLDGWRKLMGVWTVETLRRWGHDDELELVAAESRVTS